MTKKEWKRIMIAAGVASFAILVPFLGLFIASPALFFIAWMPFGDLWYTRLTAGLITVMAMTFMLFCVYGFLVQRKRRKLKYWYHIPVTIFAVHAVLLTEVYLPIFWANE